ncbi:hypothetical protein ElyMa_001723400 [Elysia marginata]|uniref:Uncharacterized protein n=1 Tax=Elysia marginata TaxID=1093978 RepID=A0AAV4JYJ8_9GAST|nr:hypothetical protein ElyMa_001723400 [Elysia marginata]
MRHSEKICYPQATSHASLREDMLPSSHEPCVTQRRYVTLKPRAMRQSEQVCYPQAMSHVSLIAGQKRKILTDPHHFLTTVDLVKHVSERAPSTLTGEYLAVWEGNTCRPDTFPGVGTPTKRQDPQTLAPISTEVTRSALTLTLSDSLCSRPGERYITCSYIFYL